MDPRIDTSSGRFGGQWAFLSNPPQHGHPSPRSLPSSSYLPRSDHSINNPLTPTPLLYHLNASRSSLLRHYPTTSIGGHTSATAPSQPVLIRVHSADASAHQHPTPRGLRRQPDMSKSDELPPVSDFSIQGILAAIQEVIEGDIDAISEILGRSRLTLADQHESHMPPQGEIRATIRPLQGIEEASSSNERLAGDDILILREDASLVDGSHAGSAAYGLLERLQTVPRFRRQRSDIPTTNMPPTSLPPPRTYSLPPVLPDLTFNPDAFHVPRVRSSLRSSSLLLQKGTSNVATAGAPIRTTNAVVSETYLSAGANGRLASNPPVVSESGRHYPLYSYDESDLFEGPIEPNSPGRVTNRQARVGNLKMIGDFCGLSTWLNLYSTSDANQGSQSAETHLREILERQHGFVPDETTLEPDEDENIYD